MSIHLVLENVSFDYQGLHPQRQVLQDVNLELRGSQCTAIVGMSGSGKTTLIQHFTGLLKPIRGKIFCDDRNIHEKRYPLAELRKRIALVFQFPETQLFEETVEKDIGFGPRNLGWPAEDIKARVRDALRAVDLNPAEYAGRSPFRLSEGEKRRVAIAGVLAMEPDMIVFDEPTAGLDPASVKRFERIVRRLLTAGTAVVIVTHNMDFVSHIANRVVAMQQGRIAFDGDPENLFADAELLQKIGLEQPVFLRELAQYKSELPADLASALTIEAFESQLKAL